MAENTAEKIKVITAPDLIFDQATSITVICPATDLKESVEEFALNYKGSINIFYFSNSDSDLQWLLTVANISDYILIDIDNCTESVSHFLSYILSIPNTYYRTSFMKAPWDLINKNRFYDFPTLER